MKELYGKELLKAMELLKLYPIDTHFQDDVNQYGYNGILERLIGHCQGQCCYASQDDAPEEFEFHKQVALVLRDAIKKINEIPVPDELKKDQPYSDGRL